MSITAPDLESLSSNVPLAVANPDRYESMSMPDDVFQKVLDHQTREVVVESGIGVDDYAGLAKRHGPSTLRDIAYLYTAAAAISGARIEEVNPTANGGGVQMILMAQINLFRELGVSSYWRLMEPDSSAFRVTKDWHNTLQGVANQSRNLEAGFDVYNGWIALNASRLVDYLSAADITTLHDPQPHGLISYLPTEQPVVWRSHIQNRTDLIHTPNTPQEAVWRFIYNGKVDKATAHVYHPVEDFIPANVPDDIVNLMPATFDPFDDLNRLNLTDQEKQNARDFIDNMLLSSHLLKPESVSDSVDWHQTGIDWGRKIIALVARFDPSKGMPPAVYAYVRAREMMKANGLSEDEIPQLVIIGNGSVDDPDGPSELAKMMSIRSKLDKEVRDEVKVIRVPHNDKAINTLMSEASIGLQPSLVEGFETRASDWIWHGKPVIVSNRGGLPLQVHEGKSGHIVDPEDVENFARTITEMVTSKAKYQEMSAWAGYLSGAYNYREFSTVANAIRWALLYGRLLNGGPVSDHRWRITEIVDGEPGNEAIARLHRYGSVALSV
ncbi:MAG: glycosyltransferase [Candidatus Saccharimonadales bacterium]